MSSSSSTSSPIILLSSNGADWLSPSHLSQLLNEISTENSKLSTSPPPPTIPASSPASPPSSIPNYGGGFSSSNEFFVPELPVAAFTPVRIPMARDFYGNGAFISAFEQSVASYLGKDCSVFLISGIMAQLIALKVHSLHKNLIFASHSLSHLELHEQQAYQHVFGFSRCSIGSPSSAPTFADVEKAITSHWKIPSSIVLELPNRELGGEMISWNELVKIKELCVKRGIALHLDGARLWEAAPYYLEEEKINLPTLCSIFDSIYVSFYKGLGGLTGSMLLGKKQFIDEAKIWQRRLGGTVYTYLPNVMVNYWCFEKHHATFKQRWEKLKTVVHKLKSMQSTFLSESSNVQQEDFFSFSPSTPQCSMVHMILNSSATEVEEVKKIIEDKYGISLFLYLRSVNGKEEKCAVEWNIGMKNLKIDDEVFVKGWKAYVEIMAEKKAKKRELHKSDEVVTSTEEKK